MQSIKDLIDDKNKNVKDTLERHKYVSTEFQDYGYRLAFKLEDLKYKTLYIKLAKEKPRALIEQAFSFAIDYPKAKNKGRIFMWKLKELEKEYLEKKTNAKIPEDSK